MLDFEWYKRSVAACFRDTPPPCSSRCPFGLDVRTFVARMAAGKPKGAYRALREAVAFPSIVSALCEAPCAESCVRGPAGAKDASSADARRPIDLNALERACIDAGATPPRRYRIPEKPQRIAIVGGGLCGLGCAFRLASWGYRVTVLERSAHLGGSARAAMDAAAFDEEVSTAFDVLSCDFRTGVAVVSLDELSEFDAFFLATGADGSAFGMQLDRVVEGIAATEHACGFAGGRLCGSTSHVGALACGLQAAGLIEDALKVGSLDRQLWRSRLERPVDARFYDLSYDCATADEVASGLDEPQREAARCLQCNCSACYDACPLMRDQGVFPRKICTDTLATLKPDKSARQNVRTIAGCTFCGACERACPEDVDMGAHLRKARIDLCEDGHFAPGFHDYWLRDLAFAQSDEARLAWVPDAGTPCEVALFPGCQLGASSPEAVLRTWEALRSVNPNAGVILSCCGVPALWAGMPDEEAAIAQGVRDQWERLGQPTLLAACPSCHANLARSLPDIPVVSLYAWLARHPDALPQDAFSHAADRMRVLDPCGAADDPDIRQAVRSLLQSHGCWVENESDEVACCGFGGHVYPAVPAVAHAFARERASCEGEIVAYCANCRDVLAAEGKPAWHVLDLAFGTKDKTERPPTLQQRRANRRKLRQAFVGETEERSSEVELPFECSIPAQVQDKMDRLLILEEEVLATVDAAEKTGIKVIDEETAVYTAHRSFENMTLWVSYVRTEDGVRLVNVYSHRMRVREDR